MIKRIKFMNAHSCSDTLRDIAQQATRELWDASTRDYYTIVLGALEKAYWLAEADTARLDWLDGQIFEDAEPFPAVRIFEEDGGVIIECPEIDGRCAGGIGRNLRAAIDAARDTINHS
jgi:hypothetical protein